MENLQTKIFLFRSLFKGREDVFATRWEKDKKSGYMPAYFFDSYRYCAHKMKGGTFQNYPDKSCLQLTDDQIAKHLNGEQVVGLYPLLSDNTSWFIAADFDEGDWIGLHPVKSLFRLAMMSPCLLILNVHVQVMAGIFGYFLTNHFLLLKAEK